MVSMPRAISRCPQCGEPVTPYAAGCAICGADIEGARRARKQRRVPALPPIRLGDDGLRFAIALIVAVAAPLFGVLIGAFLAWQYHGEGRTTARNLMLGIALLAAVPLATGIYPWARFVAGL
jgi:hypothetical protein